MATRSGHEERGAAAQGSRAAELEAILQTAIDGIVTIDERGRITSFNPAAERMFGYRASEVLGRNVSLLMPSPWRERHDDYLRRYLETGEAHIIGIGREVEGLRKDGVRFPCELAVTEGRVGPRRFFTAFVRDLTERRRMREALRRERDFAERLIDLLPAVVVLLDRDGRLERCNRYLDRLCGTPGQEASGVDWFARFIEPDDRDAARAAFARALSGEGGAVRQLASLRARDGEVRELEWFLTGVPDARGEIVGVLSVGIDVTDRLRATRGLEVQYAVTRALGTARTLAEAAPAIAAAAADKLEWERVELWETDEEGALRRRLACAPAAAPDSEGERLEGRAPQPQAVSATTFRPSPPALPAAVRGIAVPIVHARGICAGLLLSASAPRVVRAEDVALLESLAAQIGDFVDRRGLEAEFRQAQKLEAVGRLAAGLAHDFKNLLMGIRGCLALMDDDGGGASARGRFGQEIMAAIDRGVDLTRQLLTFSRRRPESTVAVEVEAQLRESVALLRSLLGEDVTLTLSLEAPGACVLAEPGQLQQILMNLVTNARDAMPGGGELEVSTRRFALSGSRARDESAGSWVEIMVRDEGCGMEPEVRARAFEPFFTTKPEGQGSGLGLSTVYGLVRQLGGHVEIESELGAGTAVRIALPVCEAGCAAAAQPAAVPSPAPGATGAGRRVLVVEDEALVRMTASVLLEALGYEVLEAATGEEALAVLEGAPPIDLLLSDMVLPGMSGPELARRLRERWPALPAVFMSAYPPDLLVEQGRLDPGTPALEKPFDEAALAAALERALRRADTPEAGG